MIKVIVALFILVIGFQNCDGNFGRNKSESKFSSGQSQKSVGNNYGGNGDPYGGKITYMAFEAGHTCPDSSGKEIAAPVGKITQADDNSYILEFDGCSLASRRILAGEVTEISDGSGLNLYFAKRLYRPFTVMPDILSYRIPDKFCIETEALNSTNSDFTFYEVNTYQSYSAGRGVEIYKRQVTENLLRFALPADPLHFANIVYEEINSIQTWLLDVFALSLDLNTHFRVRKNNIDFDNYLASVSWQSSDIDIQTEVTCSIVPIERFYFQLETPPSTSPPAAGSLPTNNLSGVSSPPYPAPTYLPPPRTALVLPAPTPTIVPILPSPNRL